MEYGLIGERLPHSYSPLIHKAIGDYPYALCELPREALASFFEKRDFSAVNVTIPYKEAVIPYLDEISPAAAAIGAVNTVVKRGGRLLGYNTDFPGMRTLIERKGVSLQGKKVLILGTGGTAKTARAVSAALGAKSIVTVSRRKSEATVTYEEAITLHTDAAVLINTTPVGMYPAIEGQPIPLDPFPALEAVFDAVYNPLRTDLIMEARERGLICDGGLYMLAAQAVFAASHFFDREPREGEIERVYQSVLKKMQSIVFIGMPSSGKSTIGRLLSERLDRPFLDSDDCLKETLPTTIADYIKKEGEGAFRDKETEVIRRLSEKGGAVIATGGGAVLRKENIRLLKKNGLVVFLDRPLSSLTPTSDRPLSSSPEALSALYERRYPLYCEAADLHLDGRGTPGEITDRLIKELSL